MHTTSAAGSIKGRTHRSNQDRTVRLDATAASVTRAGRGELFAVIDGVGGVEQGGDAADHIASRLPDFFRDPTIPPTTAGLVTLMETIDREIHLIGVVAGTNKPLAAAAVTVAWLAPHRRLVLVHAGDTLACRWDQMSLRRLTADHGTAAGLTRYAGVGHPGVYDVEEVAFETGDTLALVSDGITKVIGDDELGAAIAAHRDPSRGVAELLRKARDRYSADDASAVLVRLEAW